MSYPINIEIATLDTLHRSIRSLWIGNVGIALVTVICAYVDQCPPLEICSLVVLVTAVARVLITTAYHRNAEKLDKHSLRTWKLRTLASTAAFSAALGAAASIGIAGDITTKMILIAMVVGYVDGAASRNAGVQTVVYIQLALCLGTVAVTLALQDNGVDRALTVLAVMNIFAQIEISHTVHKSLLEALLFGQEKHTLAEELSEQAQTLDSALGNMSHGLAMFDAAGALVVHNNRFSEIFNLDNATLPGASAHAIIAAAARGGVVKLSESAGIADAFSMKIHSVTRDEMMIETCAGRAYHLVFQPKLKGGSVITLDDVTEKRVQEQEIVRLAQHDRLTDLPNRNSFEDHLARTLEHAMHSGERYAVLALDLDEFKTVNDTLGHLAGDHLLIAVCRRIENQMRPGDFVARFGGDEFMMIIDIDHDPNTAAALAQRLIDDVRKPYEVLEHTVHVGLTIGIAISPGDGKEPLELLRNADLALYSAKKDRRSSYQFFEPHMNVTAQDRRQIEIDMRAAITNGEFRLFYQPLIDLKTQKIAACEALIRWMHPLKGMIPPDRFISIAEETRYIVEMGRWILRQACQDAVSWPAKTKVSVNVSPVQFKHDDIIDAVRVALAATGLPPNRLSLEITESTTLVNSDGISKILNDLRALGVSISLDDFGTGFSSFTYLVNYPFDKVKLDRSFVTALSASPEKLSIVRAMRSVASDLGLKLVAEGVETEDDQRLLTELGIDLGQGYLFSPPVPVSDLPWAKTATCSRHLRRPPLAMAATFCDSNFSIVYHESLHDRTGYRKATSQTIETCRSHQLSI